MDGYEFQRRLRRLARGRGIMVRYATHGKGSHGRIYFGVRFTAIKDRRLIPAPSRPLQGEFSIPVPALIACKLILRQIMQDGSVSNVSLAKRLGVSEGVVRRLVDPDHAQRLDRVVAAVECLGKSIVVETCELEPA